MAQNQATGGNSMAAMLGNLQPKTQRPGQPPSANYGGGLQAPMRPNPGGAIGPYQPSGQAPIPPGGAGYPQMTPQAMQNMMGQISAQRPQLQSGAPGNMAAGLGQGWTPMGGPRQPGRMPAPGAPGMGAGGGKNQQIAQLPGAPPMGR